MNENKIKELLQDRDYTRKQILLRDGRTISYAECGNIVDGYPVIFQFGLMGSSNIVIISHKKALMRNLRLISIDYPGIGESTPVCEADRTLLNFASDVEEFVDQILPSDAIPYFGLAGHSMGAPHILSIFSNPRLQHRVSCLTFIAPWLGDLVDHHAWFVPVVRKSPAILRDHVITQCVTPLITSNALILGIRSSVTNYYDPGTASKLNTVKNILSYSTHQGNDGVRQNMKLALSSNLLPTELLEKIFMNVKSVANTTTTNSTASRSNGKKKSFFAASAIERMKNACINVPIVRIHDNNSTTPSPSLQTAKATTRMIQNTPIIIFHGTNDDMVPIEAAKKIVMWLREKQRCNHISLHIVQEADHETIMAKSHNLRLILQTIAIQVGSRDDQESINSSFTSDMY